MQVGDNVGFCGGVWQGKQEIGNFSGRHCHAIGGVNGNRAWCRSSVAAGVFGLMKCLVVPELARRVGGPSHAVLSVGQFGDVLCQPHGGLGFPPNQGVGKRHCRAATTAVDPPLRSVMVASFLHAGKV